MNNNVQLHANNCVWVSHYQLVPRFDGTSRRKRVKLPKPRVTCGTVYTLRPVDVSLGFTGWTYSALESGLPARRYGRPAAVCDSYEEARRVADFLSDWLRRCDSYGHPVASWSRVQLGWNGVTAGQTCPTAAPKPVDLERCECNLAWCEVEGLCHERRKTCLAVVDLESFRGDDPYVDLVHVIGADYANTGVYVDMIKRVFNERARAVVQSYIDEPQCERDYRSAVESEAREQMDRDDEDARYYAALGE